VGIRETLNRSPGITAGAVGGVIVLALIYIVMQVLGGGPQSSYKPPTKAWFTVDDGANFFPDSIDRIPPYDYDGKVAVLAHVFTCDSGKNKFVAYLERYTPDGKKRRQQMLDKKSTVGFEELEITGKEVKLPKIGDKGWMRKSEPRASEIMSPRCKEGKPENLIEDWPE
jgi:hypothetical protein